MLSRIWLTNIALAAAVFFVGIESIKVWTEEKKWPFEISSVQKPFSWPEKRGKQQIIPPESDYEAVVSDNLFFVDRSELTEQKPEKGPAAVPKVSDRQLKVLEQAFKLTHLYGVIIVGDDKVAFITETSVGGATGGPAKGPTSRFARVNKRGVKRAKEGDTVGRFKVKKIEETSVLLTAGGREWRVSLFDKDKPKKRVPVRKAAGPVVAGAGSKTKTGQQQASIGKKEVATKRAVVKRELLDEARNKRRIRPMPKTPEPDKR